jgi:pimeloyl-ACP methyl ester carboxylesterase
MSAPRCALLAALCAIAAACTPLHQRILQPPRPEATDLAQSDEVLARANARHERFTPASGPELAYMVFEPRNYQFDYRVVRDDRLFAVRFRLGDAGPAYEPRGSIVLLHGWSTDGRFLLPWALRLAEQGYRTIVLDLRNHGRSGSAEAGFGTREADDVLALVAHLDQRDELPTPVHLFGVSYGAVTALHVAARWSRGHDAPVLGAVVAIEPFVNAADAIRTSIVGLLQNAPHLRWHERALRAALRRRYGDTRVENAIDHAGEAIGLDLRTLDVADVLQTVDACVLHIHGRVDTLIPVESARSLAAVRPRNLYVELPDDGHFSSTARADWLSGPIGFWLPAAAATPAALPCPPLLLPHDPAVRTSD